jgi:arsenite methyltransferase
MGHELSGTAWLDAHFMSARAEYEEALRSVGIQSGWAVLDAGCGPGGFLPWIAALTGATGRIAALDLAPEHVENIKKQIIIGAYPSNIAAKAGGLTALPYADAEFDCVWSANVLEYLNDAEAKLAMVEFKRVLKPGGLLAVKDFDVNLVQLLPLDPGLISRITAKRREKAGRTGELGSWCGPLLPTRLRHAGFEDIRRRSWLIERWAPLNPHSRRFAEEIISLNARRSSELALADSDKRLWLEVAANSATLLDDPDFCLREGFTLSVGRKALD